MTDRQMMKTTEGVSYGGAGESWPFGHLLRQAGLLMLSGHLHKESGLVLAMGAPALPSCLPPAITMDWSRYQPLS